MLKLPNSSNSLISIEKASGEMEAFSNEKLYRSLCHAGASEKLAERVLSLLRNQISRNISSAKLYRMAFKLLHKEARFLAARYSLKRAIMSLGPSGYPFEQLVAALFAHKKYSTQVGVEVRGACVNHEIDVIAARNNHRLFVECKYRNRQGNKCDVKVALYVYARSLDLARNPETPKFDEFWLVTNAKFSQDAVQFGECAGLKLLSWDHPNGNGLRERIQLSQIHPLTCLTTLKVREKKELLSQNVVLCRELLQHPSLLGQIGLKESHIHRVHKEIIALTAI